MKKSQKLITMAKVTKGNKNKRLRLRGLFLVSTIGGLLLDNAWSKPRDKEPWDGWHASQTPPARGVKPETWDLVGQFLVQDRQRQRERTPDKPWVVSAPARESMNLLIFFASRSSGDPLRQFWACHALAQTIDALPNDDPLRAKLLDEVAKALS